MKLPINEIRIKPGRRAVDDSKVRELADSMKQVGLINPVTVNTNLELIAGAHRIAAAELLGWDEIEARMWDCDAFLSELAEIDENLMRNELHYLDEGAAYKRRDELLDEMNLKAKPYRPNKEVESTPLKTTEEIAAELGVSKSTYKQAKQMARDILPEVQDAIKAADLPKTDALKIARLEPELQKQVADKLTTGSESFADAIREVRRDDVIEKLNDVSTREVKRLEGKYDVIVIDPPWPIQKIEYDVRPNQVVLDYPTMTVDEIAEMKMPAADDCHLWLWTTHKYLPSAFHILESWGFKYTCTFVWHKDNGIQPIGLPKYNSEFALYARRGNPKFIDAKAFFLCFNAPSGAHSEKPEFFYDMVRRVTAGLRADMFNRRKIEGFEGWGNEAGC